VTKLSKDDFVFYFRMLEIQFNNVSSGIVKRTTKERIVL